MRVEDTGRARRTGRARKGRAAFPPRELRAEVAERVRRRRGEIELATFARMENISDETPVADPEYLEGLRATVEAALDYAIEVVELGECRCPPVPPLLVAQARLAACNGVGLETVLRRYFAGFTLFGDYVLQEAEAVSPSGGISLRSLLQAQNAQFDQLITTISEEYARERKKWLRSSDRRLAETVEKLLSGELVDPTTLPIEFGSWHVGVVAKGQHVADALRGAAATLDLRLLLIKPGTGVVWAWVSGRKQPSLSRLRKELLRRVPDTDSLALGEAGEGLAGWRTTHQQAKACLPVASRGDQPVVLYPHVGLIATLLRDEMLIDSLSRSYLRPLSEGSEAGGVLRDTLRAYLGAERNVSSAAAALGLSRSTVSNRLRTIEKRLGRPLGSCALELEAVLQLDELSVMNRSTEYHPVRWSH